MHLEWEAEIVCQTLNRVLILELKAPTMTTENASAQERANPPILSFIKDLPNICSLAGLSCALLAIYFLIIGVYAAAMMGMIWAVAFDWADGLVARRMRGRISTDSKFDGQLDLLIDIVSYRVTPAILALSYGNFHVAFLPAVFIMFVFGAIHLIYISTFDLSGGAKYMGLAIDNNSIILVFIVMFSGFFEKSSFAIVLAVCGLGFAVLNVSQIKTPKLSATRLKSPSWRFIR